jgi:hypothetical protein
VKPVDEPVTVCSCGAWLAGTPHLVGCPAAAAVHTCDADCLPHLEPQACPECPGRMLPKSIESFGVWFECQGCGFGGCHGDDLEIDCTVCHVTWGDPCPGCGGRGFHVDGCGGEVPPS